MPESADHAPPGMSMKGGEMIRVAESILVVSLLASGCGGEGREQAPVAQAHTLRATVGTYDDGAGRIGIAALTTIRSDLGQGPETGWTVTVARSGAPVAQAASYAANASYSVSSWIDVAPVAGSTYDVVATDGAETLTATAILGEGSPLALPAPVLTLDGTRLDWPAVSGATAYGCVLTSGGAVHLQAISSTAGCDLAALPTGGLLTSVRALSGDPGTLSPDAAPALPARFDVSEARLGLLRRIVGAPLVLRAAGGRIDYGLVPGLAIWMGLAAPDGAPDGGVWSIEVTGPNLPSTDPLRFDLLANFTQRMVWVYGLPPEPGLYTLTARAGAESIATQFAVSPPQPLPLPEGVVAVGKTGGSARLSWSAVLGAQSYFASAWLGATFVAGQWVTGTTADFPNGTFASGATYDAYVTASDVDMSGGAPPTRVSASENSYTPASFTAP